MFCSEIYCLSWITLIASCSNVGQTGCSIVKIEICEDIGQTEILEVVTFTKLTEIVFASLGTVHILKKKRSQIKVC